MSRARAMLEQVREYLARRGCEAEASGDQAAAQRWGEAAGHVLAAVKVLGDGDGDSDGE